jgi:hypothetical protein
MITGRWWHTLQGEGHDIFPTIMWGPARTLWGRYALPPPLACVRLDKHSQQQRHSGDRTSAEHTAHNTLSCLNERQPDFQRRRPRAPKIDTSLAMAHTFTAASSSHQDLQVPGGIGACK